jgi:hypothetical protein
MPVKDSDKVYFKIKSGAIKTGVYDAKTKMVLMSGGKKAKPPKRALHHTRKGAMDKPFVDVTNKDPVLGAKPTKKNEKEKAAPKKTATKKKVTILPKGSLQKRLDEIKRSEGAKNLSKKRPTYQERAKKVFEEHKKFFGKDHYAQVEIAGIGTVNWDGYTLYEKGLFSRADKIGTYKNEKHLDEWNGDSVAFSKYEPLELNQNAKGLRLTRIP